MTPPKLNKPAKTSKSVFYLITLLNTVALFLVISIPILEHDTVLNVGILLKVSLLAVLQYSVTKRTFS